MKSKYELNDILRCKKSLQEYKLTAIGNSIALVEIETNNGNTLEIPLSIVELNELEKYSKKTILYFQFRALWTNGDSHNNEDHNYYVTNDDIHITLSRVPYMSKFLNQDKAYAGLYLHSNALIIAKNKEGDINEAKDLYHMTIHREDDMNFYVMGYFYCEDDKTSNYFDAQKYLPSIKTMEEAGYDVKLPNEMSNEELETMVGHNKLKGCIVTKK
jgi:hypothetical protein